VGELSCGPGSFLSMCPWLLEGSQFGRLGVDSSSADLCGGRQKRQAGLLDAKPSVDPPGHLRRSSTTGPGWCLCAAGRGGSSHAGCGQDPQVQCSFPGGQADGESAEQPLVALQKEQLSLTPHVRLPGALLASVTALRERGSLYLDPVPGVPEQLGGSQGLCRGWDSSLRDTDLGRGLEGRAAAKGHPLSGLLGPLPLMQHLPEWE
jgi:hypothetical protein